MNQKGFAPLFILLGLVILIGLVSLGYFYIQNQNKVTIPAQQAAQPINTAINNNFSNINSKDKRLVAYSDEEIFEYQPGKNGVRGKDITIYDIAQNSKKIILSDNTQNYSYYPQSWSPDGTKLIITSGMRDRSATPHGVFTEKPALLDLTSGRVEDLTEDMAGSWYSNSELVNFLTKDTYVSVMKYDINSKQSSELVRIPKVDNLDTSSLRDFAFSPDKSKIVYGSFSQGDPANIYVYDLKTNQVKKLTNNPTSNVNQSSADTSPQWIDNNSIIFQKRQSTGDSIWMIDSNSSKQTLLAGGEEGIDSTNAFRYTFSADKKQLIYPSKNSKQGQDIMALDFTSKTPKLLFNVPYGDFTNAQVTSDNKYLIFSSLTLGTFGKTLFIYDISQEKLSKICEPSTNLSCQSFFLH